MEIKVRKYSTTNQVYYDVVVKTCNAVIEGSLFEEEASDIAKEFFLETALDVKYEDHQSQPQVHLLYHLIPTTTFHSMLQLQTGTISTTPLQHVSPMVPASHGQAIHLMYLFHHSQPQTSLKVQTSISPMHEWHHILLGQLHFQPHSVLQILLFNRVTILLT